MDESCNAEKSADIVTLRTERDESLNSNSIECSANEIKSGAIVDESENTCANENYSKE